MGISANAAPLERGLAAGKTRQIPVISMDSLYSFPMEISFFPFCANKFRKRIPGLAFRMVISSNGLSWCFSHSLDHDPVLWHLFPVPWPWLLWERCANPLIAGSFLSQAGGEERDGNWLWGPPSLPSLLQSQWAKIMWIDEVNYFTILWEG